MNMKEVFWRMLPYYMNLARMNQTELGKAVGVSKSTVSCWMSQKSFPAKGVGSVEGRPGSNPGFSARTPADKQSAGFYMPSERISESHEKYRRILVYYRATTELI